MQFLRLLYDVTRAKEACVNMNLVPLPEILSDADEERSKKRCKWNACKDRQRMNDEEKYF